MPASALEQLNKILKKRKELIDVLGRDPSYQEIADELDLSEDRVAQLMETSIQPISLDTPINAEEDSFIGDLISDQKLSATKDIIKNSTKKDGILKILDTLDKKEKEVLVYRFGLQDGVSRSLEATGEILGVTRERVRQIEMKALRKMRQPEREKMLKKTVTG